MISLETRKRIREILEARACKRQTITYGELVAELPGSIAPHSPGLFAALGELSERTHREHDIFLSALVVKADTRIPGEGFFTKMAFPVLGVESVPDRERFWEEQRDSVFDFYACDR